MNYNGIIDTMCHTNSFGITVSWQQEEALPQLVERT